MKPPQKQKPIYRILVLSLAILSLSFATADESESVIHFKVIEYGSPARPVEGASIGWMSGDAVEMEILASTDRQGQCHLKLPKRVPKYGNLYVQKEGFLAVLIESIHLLGDSTTVNLVAAKEIGGTVTDSTGAPVEGAKVSVSVFHNLEGRISNQHIINHNNASPAVTDSSGNWMSSVASNYSKRIYLNVTHPDFCSERITFTEKPDSPSSVLESLLNKKNRTTLHEGVTFKGTVVDEVGKPISMASIAAGHGDMVRSSATTYSTEADSDGRFTARFKESGDRFLFIRKDGYVPFHHQLSKSPEIEAPRIVMTPGTPVEVQLEDQDGEPIVGAYIAPTVRELPFLFLGGNTDSNGKWRNDSAPDATIPFRVYKAGFQSLQFTRQKGQTKPIKLQLGVQPSIDLTVRDATTGELLSEFTVTTGSLHRGVSSPFWNRSQTQQGTNGKLKILFENRGVGEIVYLVEANGYLPRRTQSFKSPDQNFHLELLLEPAVPIRGTVTGINTEKTIVVALDEGQFLGVNGSGFDGILDAAQRERKNHVLMSSDGTFEISPGLNTQTLVIASDSGIAIVSHFPPGEHFDVQLKPYSKVTGTISPRKKRKILLRYPPVRRFGNPPLAIKLTTTSTATGSYQFQGVPPGHYEIGEVLNTEPMTGRETVSIASEFDIGPGDEELINWGGTGRPIRGRAVLAGGIESHLDWTEGNYEVALAPPFSGFPMRSNYGSDEDFQLAMEKIKEEIGAFLQTAEGQEFMANRKSYPIHMNADGSFESLELAPGRYQVDLRPKTWESTGRGKRTTSIGMGFKKFEVPEGFSEEFLDIGDVEVELLGRLPVGKKAPDFEVLDKDGKTLRLSDYQGKYVLLDFWSTTCGPCVAEMPSLLEAFEAFKDHPKFEMIALSLDEDWEAIERFKRRHKMPWKNVRVGPFRTSKVLEDYGVYGIPENFLISPDGVVLRKSMRGTSLYSALKETLPTTQ